MQGAVNLANPATYLRAHEMLEFFLLLGEKVKLAPAGPSCLVVLIDHGAGSWWSMRRDGKKAAGRVQKHT